jgi:hypothetical protein
MTHLFVVPIITLLLTVSIGANGSELNKIDFLSGDVHKIIKADETELISKYTVFRLEILVKGFGDDLSSRAVIFMRGFNQIMDTSKYDYIGQSSTERKSIAQKAFDDFSGNHGKVVDEKTKFLRAESSQSSKVELVTYKFNKEHGYTPSLTLQWSNSVVSGTTLYELKTIEIHQKLSVSE